MPLDSILTRFYQICIHLFVLLPSVPVDVDEAEQFTSGD